MIRTCGIASVLILYIVLHCPDKILAIGLVSISSPKYTKSPIIHRGTPSFCNVTWEWPGDKAIVVGF